MTRDEQDVLKAMQKLESKHLEPDWPNLLTMLSKIRKTDITDSPLWIYYKQALNNLIVQGEIVTRKERRPSGSIRTVYITRRQA